MTHSADAANVFVRSVIDGVSSSIGAFGPEEWEEAKKFFGGACAYTGLRKGGLQKDHVVPTNRKHGGLSIKGNIVPATKDANAAKAGKTLEQFFASDVPCLAHLSKEERAARKAKIEEFQRIHRYNEMAAKLSENFKLELQQMYDKIQSLSDEYINKLLNGVQSSGDEGFRMVEASWAKKYDRVYLWADKPNNNSYKIFKLFLEYRDKVLNPNDFIEIVRRNNISQDPYGAVRSMMTDAGHSYGRVFMDDDGVLVLVPELQDRVDELLKLYNVAERY